MKKNKDSIILGIESSCDDTSAAILKNGILLSNVTANQKVHEKYGGVVPELASMAHQENSGLFSTVIPFFMFDGFWWSYPNSSSKKPFGHGNYRPNHRRCYW